MTELEPLNTMRFFCRECGIGTAHNCTNFHPQLEPRPGYSPSVFLLSGLIILIAGVVVAGRFLFLAN